MTNSLPRPIRSIIIDDEPLACSLLELMLKSCDNIEIIKIEHNPKKAIEWINTLKPDLIFLDIQMPQLTGIELLEIIDHRPQVIFTTAFNEHAIKAFDLNAIDYLLKPYTVERLQKALGKVSLNTMNPPSELYSNPSLIQTEPRERIVVKDKGVMNIIPCQDIKYLEGAQDYVKIFTTKGMHIKHITMQAMEDMMASAGFLRTHRSYIVNPNYVNRIHLSQQRYYIILEDNIEIPVSRNKQNLIKTRFSN